MKTALIKPMLIFFLAVLAPLKSIASPDFWVDVRSEREYAESHVSGAVHIPYETIKAQIATLTRDKDAVIYLYCGSGHRAGIAMNDLESMGYTRVKNIGGLDDAVKLEESSRVSVPET